MNNICIFIESNNSQKCNHKGKYGNYCYKHRRNYLIKDNIICRDKFTGEKKDYLKKDIEYYIKNVMKSKLEKSDKKDAFEKIKSYILNVNRYYEITNDPRIIQIQALYRGNKIRKQNKELKCNNDEDFYEDLTDSIIRERKDAIKQKSVDLFSCIEQSGYTCQIEWFMNLSLRRLKTLYKNLEDIWNYRSQLTIEMKRKICPPNADIFRTPMIEVMNYSCKEDLQELILHEVMKFTNAESDSDRKLGFMYFLIAIWHILNG
jgi:hypothetical protein